MPQTQAHRASPVLSPGTWEELRQKLLAERQRLTKDYRRDIEAVQEIEEDSAGDLEEIATLEGDRERLFAHSEQDRQILLLIEEAFQRMEEGTYGLCQETGEPIPVERLRLIPWARYSAGAQERIEKLAGTASQGRN